MADSDSEKVARIKKMLQDESGQAAMTERWLVRINGHEGGYCNRDLKSDPGGETKWGISKRSYPHLDIKNLSLSDAARIYEKDFIEPLTKHRLPHGLTFQLLDFAVHSGIKKAIKVLQRELGIRPENIDGVVGPETRGLIIKLSESDLTQLALAGRLDFLASLDNWPQNSRGWARRIANNLRYGAEDTD